MSTINNRYEFIVLFDVENGNPNGDPDAGNAPRIDPETSHGYITDVCIKRKIRNYINLVCEGRAGYNILIQPEKPLNTHFAEAYAAEGLEKGAKSDEAVRARDYMCRNYFDVRAFGAVMSTGDNPCGIVRGPVQLNFARSISPINIIDVTITRQAKTNEERKAKSGDTEIGRKSVVPYALYRLEGYISAAQAQRVTGLSDEDVELLWSAIINMFEEDHSAARGKMCVRKLIVFKHDNPLGCCPSHILFDKVTVNANEPDMPARSYSDYTVTVDYDMPAGVTLEEKL